MTFPRFFNAQELGHSLKEVATDLVATTHHDIISRWFHSAKDADLYIWLDINQNVIKQQMSFYGQVVEWNVVEGLKTGLIIEEEAGARTQGSEMVQFDSRPQEGTLDQALALLDHITALKEQERVLLAKNFRQSPSLSTLMPAEMFIERFGAYLKSPKREEASAARWLRLRAFVKRLTRL